MQFQDELFGSEQEIYPLDNGRLLLTRNFLDNSLADQLFYSIKEKSAWKESSLFIAGKYIKVPRLNAWYADAGMTYTYSGILLQPESWYKELSDLKDELFKKTNEHFNSCLLNLYRSGTDSVAWHCDDEPELGRNPLIASVSLGTERKFVIRSLTNHSDKLVLKLPHNSLLIMEGEVQHKYEHSIPKEPAISTPRVNLTFRQMT